MHVLDDVNQHTYIDGTQFNKKRQPSVCCFQATQTEAYDHHLTPLLLLTEHMCKECFYYFLTHT